MSIILSEYCDFYLQLKKKKRERHRSMEKLPLFWSWSESASLAYITKQNRTSFFLLDCCLQTPTAVLLNPCPNKFQRPLGARFGNTSAYESLSKNWNLCFKNSFSTSWLRRPEVRASFSLFWTESKQRKLGEKDWFSDQDTNKQNACETLVCNCTDTRKKSACIQSFFYCLTGNNDC